MTTRMIRVLVHVTAVYAMACGSSNQKVDPPTGASPGSEASTISPDTSPPAASTTGPASTGATTPTSTEPSTHPSASASNATSATPPAASAAPAERPFAHTPMEAQSMIQQQVETRLTPLWKCVEDLRARRNDAHRAVVVDIGIDEEGHLIGVTSVSPDKKKKASPEPELNACMTTALKGLLFPRSHAGVISVRQTFKDEAAGQ